MRELAVSAGALPAETSAAFLMESFEVFRRNLQAVRRYVPEVYPGRIELFRCAATAASLPGEHWHEHAGGGVAVHEMAGDHYALMKTPRVGELAERLMSILAGRRSHTEPACASSVRR